MNIVGTQHTSCCHLPASNPCQLTGSNRTSRCLSCRSCQTHHYFPRTYMLPLDHVIQCLPASTKATMQTHATTHKYYHTRCYGCRPQGAATGLGTTSSGYTRKPGTHAWSATHHMHCKCQHRHTCQDVTLTFSTDHRHSMQKQAAPTLAVSVNLRCISMPRMEMHASGHETAAQGHFRVPPQQWLQVPQTSQTVETAADGEPPGRRSKMAPGAHSPSSSKSASHMQLCLQTAMRKRHKPHPLCCTRCCQRA